MDRSAKGSFQIYHLLIWYFTELTKMATGDLPRGYDYEFVHHVDRRFFCLICEMPFKDAVQTKCGHKFCRECLTESMRRWVQGLILSSLKKNIHAQDSWNEVQIFWSRVNPQFRAFVQWKVCSWFGWLVQLDSKTPDSLKCNWSIGIISNSVKWSVRLVLCMNI